MMEAVKEVLPLVLQGSLLLLVFSLGLASTGADAAYLFRRPGLLLRSVAAIDVVVPLAAALAAILLPLAPPVKLAIVLMAVSPVPPLVPGKQLRMGAKTGYVCGLYLAVSLLAIAVVPLTMAILSALLPRDAWVAPAAVARVVFVTVLVPLAIGMAVRRLSPGLAERAAPVVSKLASLLLLLGFVTVLIGVWPAARALLGNGAALAIAGVVGTGLLAGHLLGGPDREDRKALAVASATRHPGTAFVIAKAIFPAEEAAPAVLLFLVVGMVAALPYQVWSRKLA
jgi:BASS family bile acid:Na+ symporter